MRAPTASRHGSAAATAASWRVEGEQLGVESIELQKHPFKCRLGERLVEALAMQPAAVPRRPGAPVLAVDAPVAQQLLADALASGDTHAAQIVAAAHEVTQALLCRCRWADEGELAGAIEAHELHGVAAVGLDAVARAHRRERGRDRRRRRCQARTSRR